MAYTFDAQIVSDLHKDAYGVRPSSLWWECWRDATDDERQAEWDDLLQALERTIAREKAEELEALADFEADLAKVMEIGRCDEMTALSWMTPLEFDETQPNSQDVEHWVWQAGILFTPRGRQIVELIKQFYGVK